MGTKWMIELAGSDTPCMWWTGSEWTFTAYDGLQFDTEEDAHFYFNSTEWHNTVSITEHLFMSPISTPEKLN